MRKDEVKAWLYEVRDKQKQRRSCLNRIDNIKDECNVIRECKASVMNLGKVGSRNTGKPTEQKAVKILDKYRKEFEEKIDVIESLDVEIDRIRKEIDNIFEQTDMTVSELETIIYYYFEGMSNVEVAKLMNYSEQSILRLKDAAIRNILEYKKEKE